MLTPLNPGRLSCSRMCTYMQITKRYNDKFAYSFPAHACTPFLFITLYMNSISFPVTHNKCI